MGVSGLLGWGLPFTHGRPPLGLGIAGSESPSAVLWALLRFLADNRSLLVATAALSVAAVLLPEARRRGAWGAALWGSGLLVALVLLPQLAGGSRVSAFPLVAFVWIAAASTLLRRTKGAD